MSNEVEKIKERYNRRRTNPALFNKKKDFYFNYFIQVEREFVYFNILRSIFQNSRLLKFIEIGAGNGSNLFFFIKNGILPENIYANELLEDRLIHLKKTFPTVNTIIGNAQNLNYKKKFDIVFQSTVFTSILDKKFKIQLAKKMWEMKKEKGIILWYDFIYDNPFNKDVKGINKNEIKTLFPMASEFIFYKTTLAPPIGRRIRKFYNFLNILFPFLRTHVIAVIK